MGEVHQLILHQGVEEARRLLSGDKTDRLCVDAAYEVMADDRGKVDIAHAGFAMAALPHRRTTEAVWEREGGQIKLLVESGLDSAKQPIGIPYGAVARMILLYLQTQAVKTRSREIELGASMNAWLTAMDIPIGGKTYQIVREQSRRISRCRLTFFRRTSTAELVTNGAFVRDAILPLDPTNAGQMPLWQEKVRLDEGFYQSLIEHPLPLRETAIRLSIFTSGSPTDSTYCLVQWTWAGRRCGGNLEKVTASYDSSAATCFHLLSWRWPYIRRLES